jgi:hypothetical protein
MKSFTEYLAEKKDSAYELFFQKALAKFGVDSPEDLDDNEKKKFFDYIDQNWKADKESD